MNTRGSTLVVALIFSTVVLLVATALVRVIFGGSYVYGASREHRYAELAAAAALHELNACLYSRPFPPASAPSCPSWSCSSAQCTKTAVVDGWSYGLRASWSAGALSIESTPAATAAPASQPPVRTRRRR